jgi:hypothetical protein
MGRSSLLYISFSVSNYAQIVRAKVTLSCHTATQLPTTRFSRQSVIVKARVRSYASPCEICDGKGDLGQVLFPVLRSSLAFIIPQRSDFNCLSSTTEVTSATDSVLPVLDLYTVNIEICAVV